MGHCLFLNTEASGITIVFITPFDQIDFAEAHRISQAFRQAQKCHISLKPRGTDSDGVMADLYVFSAR